MGQMDNDPSIREQDGLPMYGSKLVAKFGSLVHDPGVLRYVLYLDDHYAKQT